MSKISDRFKHKEQEKMFYKKQNENIGDFISKGQEIKRELGLDALKNYLVDHFVDLELNTFFSKLSKDNQARYSTQLLSHYAIAYGNDFVFSVGRETKIKLDAAKEKVLINEDVIEVLKNKKTEPTAAPTKPKGLRV